MTDQCAPPYCITPAILHSIERIGEALGKLRAGSDSAVAPVLRRGNRIKTIQASLAIEGNTLSLEQVTAVLAGKRVLAQPREIQEVRNAFAAYEKLPDWFAHSHMDLLAALEATDEHPLVASCVFHYEFEFIHPFADGNGRMGRLWQTLILSHWRPIFALLPVESIIRDRQQDYYAALGRADHAADSTAFIEFMLGAVQQAIEESGLASDQESDHQSDQVIRLIHALQKSQRSASDLMTDLGLSHRPTFRKNYLHPALGGGLIEMTQPGTPRARNQKYRLTGRGMKRLKGTNEKEAAGV